MKYILDQTEMNALAPRDALNAATAALKGLRPVILEAHEYDCWQDVERRGIRGYCDDCPIGRLEHHPGAIDAEVSRMVCTLPRNYSK